MKLQVRGLLIAGVVLTFGAANTNQVEAGGLLAKLFKGKCCASEPASCEEEPEPVCCEPAPEPVCCEPEPAPEPVCCEPEPAPEPAGCCAHAYPLPELAEGEILLSISPIMLPSSSIATTVSEGSIAMVQTTVY